MKAQHREFDVMLSEKITGTVTIPLTVLNASTALADDDYLLPLLTVKSRSKMRTPVK